MIARRAGAAATLLIALTGCISPLLGPDPEFFAGDETRESAPVDDGLRVMTLNLAHGRGNGFHQALQGKDRALANLKEIEGIVQREHPHVIALQEADQPSGWSGDFDHVEFLANSAGFDWGVHTAHAEGVGLSYGTAVLSRLTVADYGAYTFNPAAASLPKGFSLATVDWSEAGLLIDVVSVHLEPLRMEIRQRQARELVAALADRPRPLVVMGDFNSDAEDDDSPLRNLARKLDLQLFRPDTDGLSTYGSSGSRLDWILLSRQLDYVDQKIWPDVVSDHRAVVAEISLAAD